LKGAVKGMKRVTEVNPQITANLLELSVENLVAAIAGAEQTDRDFIDSELITVSEGGDEFDLDHNDVVESSEIVYVKKSGQETVRQTRSRKYASNFVGDNRVTNKGFDTTVGNWVKGHEDDGISIETGGQSGNCLKYIAGATAADKFLTLPGSNAATILTDLVEGQQYRLQIALKEEANWSEKTVTLICGAGSIAITPTDSWVVTVIEFTAGAEATEISLNATSPASGGILYVDSLELERVDYPTGGQQALGQIGYVMNWGDNKNGKASVIFMAALAIGDQIIISYTYELEEPGDHTTIIGGEIANTDYIDNVAIVGNVSGKTKPVICMVKNALADAGFSLATAPRDEAVPAIVFTGHYDPDDLDTEPWEMRWPNA